MSTENGRKAMAHAIAIVVASLVEQAVTEAIERIFDWAKAWRTRRKPGPT